MTAPTLTLDHATRFAVPCVWRTGPVPIPATLIVSKGDHFGDWSASLVTRRWATLFLTDDDRNPWGRWSNYTLNLAKHETAAAALDAAWATPQIDRPVVGVPNERSDG